MKLARHVADLIGLCPFHDDHEPSLVVSPKKNLWHCLGACNAGGTAIDWVMKAEGVSFRHAVELLRADVPATSTSEPVKVSTVRKLPAPVERGADDARLLEQVAAYYHETLKQSPEALGYLARRGLTHPEMIARFRLGYANRTLGLRLPAKNRRAGEEMRAQLQRLGVMRESGHEHLNGSLAIPVFSLAGEVMQMYGRKINGDALRPEMPLHLWLPGPQRGVWNEEAIQASKDVVLCESPIEALTFWCAGYRNVTASCGVNGFTDDHRAAFRKHGVKQVWIAYDRDGAGDKSALVLAEELMARGIDCYRILFPKGMDANEYALKVTPAEKSLGLLINRAQWLGKGKPPERAKVEVIPAPAAKEKIPEPVLSLAADKPSPAAEVNGEEIAIALWDRRYRVRGLARNQSCELLKVNLLASHGEGFHVDTLDLYSARQRAAFVKQAALETGLAEDAVKHDLRHVLRKLEELQDAGLRKALEPAKPEIAMSEGDRAAALDLLADPDLLGRIVADFARCGVVGEETNKKMAYLAAVSRLLEAPLAVIVQSSSAAGKSSLMDAVLALMPEEQRVEYSAMTKQSLFYMGETDLKNKILAIVEEEGAQRAAYALKLPQSEGAFTIASTGKDPATGRLVTHRYPVEGPVAIFLTTTAIEVDEELLNRCLVLTVDEDRAQTLEGLLARHRRQTILALHRNAQRLLRPLAVVNPYAHELSFPDHLTRARRDHMKYLALIRSVTLLHQYQRPIKMALVADKSGDKRIEYIESAPDDIRAAGDLIQQVLGRTLGELPPQTRRLLLLVDEMVSKECARLQIERADFRFSRREVRESTGWSDAQLNRHLHKLEELEYLIAHRGGRGQSFVYELFFERPADPEKPFLPGLRQHYDEKKYGPNDEKNGPGTPVERGYAGMAQALRSQ